MPSFISFVLPWYAIGFLALAFWWRWWLLLPIGVIVGVLGKIEADSIARADGPALALGMAIFVFLCIGAGSGFLASALVIIGRWRKWLHPLIVLPVVFVLGFGSYFAANWMEKRAREARRVPPPADCVDNPHPARLGDVELSIPIAPNIFMESSDAIEGHYLFSVYANQMAREFCADADVSPPALTSVSINLDGTPSRRAEQTKHPFCARKHPDLPWADMTCNLIPVSSITDMPVRLRASNVRPGFDVIATERNEMLKSQPSKATDGVKTYAAQHAQYLQRPDGYFARCHKSSSPRQPYLYCSAHLLYGGVVLSYDFRTAESVFLTQSAVVETNARAIFDSLKETR